MQDGPVLSVDMVLNGRVVTVDQPIDGLTDSIMEIYEEELDAQDKLIDDLSAKLDYNMVSVLASPEESAIFSTIAGFASKSSVFSPQKQALLKVISSAMREFALAK